MFFCSFFALLLFVLFSTSSCPSLICFPLTRLAEKMPQEGDRDLQVSKLQDRGWAWMVLIAAVLVQGLTLAFPSCIGVFFKDLQSDFQATNSETSWFPSIMTAVLHAGG